MCDPVTGFMIAGAVIQGVGSAMGAANQATSYGMQAAMDERQAKLEREKGSYEGARATERGQQAVGKVVAGAAASGLNPSTGTTKEMVIQTGESAGLDVAAIRYGARVASENATNRASVNRFNAASANAAIPIAFLSPIIGAFSRVGTPLTGMYATA